MEILDPAPGPENVRRVASGGADLCLTSVLHYARARAGHGDLPARFAAVVVQRSPMAALVAADSQITAPADLAARRVGAPDGSVFLREYEAALARLGIGRPTVVPVPYAEAPAALGRGEVDVVPDFIDLLPRVRRQSGIAVRGIPVGPEVYSSGLVAADRLPDDLVLRVRAAVVAALERQRREPQAGLQELARRYPDSDPADALEGWSLVEPNIFTGTEPGSMDASRWHSTLRHVSATHDLALLAPPTVYRPELATVAA